MDNTDSSAIGFLQFKTANFLPNPRFPFHSKSRIERLHAATAEALFYYFSNQQTNITIDHIKQLTEFFAFANKNTTAFLSAATVIDSDTAGNNQQLPFDNQQLNQLLKQCRQDDFAINLVAQATKCNKLQLPSPFSKNPAYCQESYEVRNGAQALSGMNCLRFIDGNHSFFLMQFASSADGIYFPEINLLVCLAHLNTEHVAFLQKKILGDFARIIAYVRKPKSFYGMIANHYGGLGHFYYENWPVLMEIKQQGNLYQQLPHIIMRKGNDYNDLGFLFGEPTPQIMASADIDNMALNTHNWFVFVGTGRHLRSNTACYDLADNFLVNKVIANPTNHALAKLSALQNCYPIVWIGVEGQKRCWLEQVDGYAHIINQLAQRYPQLGVVIDGWTIPFSESKQAVKEAEKDRRLALKIVKKFKQALPYTLLMGENSNTKITVGKQIDFFIANFASGSLHVSRLLGKPGFCHLSGALSTTSLRYGIQIHPNRNVFLLPKHYVQDRQGSGVSFLEASIRIAYDVYCRLILQAPKKPLNLGRVSYSIDKQAFYAFIEQRLEKVLLKPQNHKLRFFMEPSFSIHPDVRYYLKMASYNNVLEVFPTLPTLKSLEDLKDFSESFLKQHIIYGLYAYGSHQYLNQPSEFMIWLSAPYDQVRLHALQILQNARAEGQPADMGSVLNAGYEILDNYYTRLLSNTAARFGECTEAMLNEALANLSQHFVFIGINEQQTQSFDRLCVTMDWDRSLFPNELSNQFSIDSSQFSEADQIMLTQLTEYDTRLYQAALRLIDKVF